MNMLMTGRVQTMTVLREIETGYVLAKDGDEALLHHNETEYQLNPGQKTDVFLYYDKKGQIIATTTLPSVQMDTYNWVDVVEVIPDLGAFVNIGIAKEILVSKDDLPLLEEVWPEPGDKLYITLGKDRKERLLAIPAAEGVFSRMWDLAPDKLLHSTVIGRIYQTGKEGSVMITTENYRGFIHYTERKQEPRLGEEVTGRVIEVKVDGTLNVSLRPLKRESMTEDAAQILEHLHQQDGAIPFSNKSEPDDIRDTFQISKGAFKRALGKLMKEGKIEQHDGNTYLK